MKSESSEPLLPKEDRIRPGEKLPHRFGNRKKRRKLESEIRKIK